MGTLNSMILFLESLLFVKNIFSNERFIKDGTYKYHNFFFVSKTYTNRKTNNSIFFERIISKCVYKTII